VLTRKSQTHSEITQPIRCIIADDHELVRYGVRRLLEDDPDFAVVAESGDAADALKSALHHRPDLVLLDIGMPGMSSFEAGKLITEHCSGTRVVFLTMHDGKEYVEQALCSGASGYLLKDTPTPSLLRALRGIYRGERSWSPQVLAHFKDDGSGRNHPMRVPMRRSILTGREREVMKLLAEGRTVREAASVLGVSVKTIEAHKFNLMRKLDIHNKAQLVTAAIREKVLPVPLPM
jgi:two-component system, NarL family, response regulator NreC